MDTGSANIHKGQNMPSGVWLTPAFLWAPTLVTLLGHPQIPRTFSLLQSIFFTQPGYSSQGHVELCLTTWWLLPGNSVACDTEETVPALTWVCIFMVLLLHCAPNSMSRAGWLCLHSLCFQSRGRDVSPFIQNYAKIGLEALQIMETI